MATVMLRIIKLLYIQLAHRFTSTKYMSVIYIEMYQVDHRIYLCISQTQNSKEKSECQY